MAPKYTRPRGTQDVLPPDAWKWQYAEDVMKSTVTRYGYREIRLPTFESTDLFARGVGEGTDIVGKEMYTFTDKGGRSVTLRPEGTAGVVRAVLENGLLATCPLPLKSWYLQSAFRYERAQKGRLREFHQMGVECFGAGAADADAETMALGAAILKNLGVLSAVTLEINSIGCPQCRPAYHAALRAYLSQNRAGLCGVCQARFDVNPMRILDCKEAKCQRIVQDAPVMLDYLCDDCKTHFETVKQQLDDAGVSYTVNKRIVRGLDYYTGPVFEFVATGIGAQGTVCAGGRYNGLIEELGGPPTPAVGFGMGVERVLLLMEETGKLPPVDDGPHIYLAAADDAGRTLARRLANDLRAAGFAAETDLLARGVKAQMKAAARLGSRYTAVLGEKEIESGRVTVRRLADGTEHEHRLDDFAAKAHEWV